MKKKILEFFDCKSVEELERKKPKIYKLIEAFCLICFLMPMLAVVLITVFLFPVDSGFILLAVLGSFILGVGIFSLVSVLIDISPGNIVTVSCSLVGGLIILVSFIIMYVPSIYALINETIVTTYFVYLLISALYWLFYSLFRSGIESWLKRQGLSENKIDDLKEGKRNYWWYEEIHKVCNMGWLYHINKIFTIIYAVTFVTTILFAWSKTASIPLKTSYTILSVFLLCMNFFEAIQSNLDEYGVPFVIYKQQPNMRSKSILKDILGAVFPLILAYALWRYTYII